MPIYDYEYNGKIYSFESDEQPNEQEVMDFITSYKEPKPAVKETPQVEQPVLQGGVKKVSEDNPYADIVNNPDLTPEQMAEQIQARGEQERRDLDWELAKYKTKSRAGLGLQLLSATPGLNVLGSGALFGLGQSLIDDKNLLDTVKQTGLYAAGAKVGELGLRGLGRLAQTKPAQAAFEAIAQSPVGKKAKEVGEKIASSKPVKNVSEFLLKPRGIAKETNYYNNAIEELKRNPNIINDESFYQNVDKMTDEEQALFYDEVNKIEKNLSLKQEYNNNIKEIEKIKKEIKELEKEEMPKEIQKEGFEEIKNRKLMARRVLEAATGKKYNKRTAFSKNGEKNINEARSMDRIEANHPELFEEAGYYNITDEEAIERAYKELAEPQGSLVQKAWLNDKDNELSSLHQYLDDLIEKNKQLKLEQPKTLQGETKPRKLPQSVLKAEGTPKEVKEIIKNDLPQYQVLHNNELTARAIQEVEQDFDNELSRLTGAKEFEALDYEKSRQIAKRLFANGRHQEAVNLMDNVAENATKKGQAIQALSLWSNMTPEGAVYKAEKLVKEFNKKNPKKQVKLTDENINNIMQLQNDVLNATDDVVKTQNMAKTAKYISELVPANFAKKLKAYRNISLLLNPKTLGRNIIGNVLFNTVDTVAKGLAVPIDKAIGLVTKKQTRVAPQLKELFKGGVEGAKTGYKEALEGIDTRGLGQRFDLGSGRTFESPVGRFFETGLDIGLRVPDRIQYEATFAESVANMTKAQGLKKPTQEILEQAEREALESVFQNESALSDLTLGLRKGLNKIGTKDFGLGDLLIPYAQTPANLAQQGINYSPLGLVKAITSGDQRQASLDIARALLGSGIIYGGYTLGKKGLATPSQFDENYFTNRDIKNNLQVLGIRPDQIGDIWYAPFQPASIPLSVGIASAYGENPLQAGTNTLLDLPFMTSVSRAVSDVKDKGVGEATLNFAGSVPSQFVPTGLSQVAQVIDPYQRETLASNKLLQGVNQAIGKVPFASKTLPEKIDVTGKPIERYSTDGARKLFDIFLNPTFINEKTDDPIISELKMLYNNTNETKQFLLTADKSLKRVKDENGKNLKLTGKQLSEYQKALGEKTYEEFDYLMGSDEYNNADDETKVKMLNDKRNAVKQLVEYEMFGTPISKQYVNKVNNLYIKE